MVTKSNTVVLGLGFATLISVGGTPGIVVGNVDGVRIAGVLLEAGSKHTSSLIRIGGDLYKGDKENPTVLSDVFARVGGPTDSN